MNQVDEKTKERIVKVANVLNQSDDVKEAWASFEEIEPVIYVRLTGQEPDEFFRLKVQDEGGPLRGEDR